MIAGRIIVGIVAGALAAAGTLVAPAFGATDKQSLRAPTRQTVRTVGGFTPAAGDPRLAALLARGNFGGDFRFTPAESRHDTRAMTVAVRARTNRGVSDRSVAAADTTIGLAPIAYNLGVAVGWKRFVIASDVTRVDLASQPGGREAADVALSYSGKRWTGRVAAVADRPLADTPRAVADLPSYSVDLGGSYSLTRNLDVTAGVRYRLDRERLTQAADQRRDSQAVYVGTAFRF
ncbi:hypothetical protein [Sphingomonas mollis]|uniref:Porin n=1 Tax=Sphingomonas mollis TaxID=2795726 RepID=A0ABS0XQX6_9SPHN|nr:hypothetical protein [Sphingomonas sp. BT553]MBJ6122434.1 hypothetical protein [Sphingomonas sp. BT553]